MVEEFRNTEIAELCESPEQAQAWRTMADALGLAGQAKVVKDTPLIPFALMSEEMIRVYELLCPDKSKLDDFAAEPLPMRVLELVDECQRKSYFPKGMEVWYNKSSYDPILVGAIQHPESTWRQQRFIVARWGDELQSYAELKQRAMRLFIEKSKFKLQSTAMQIQAALADMEAYAMNNIVNGERGIDLPF